ncbi:MAG: family 10 glycosylhydrolase [Candidatus Sumerlaeaceae bacterium]|nr:family 10 glycosylhydrolase [Candidatus Sumerlaeaceae bacterium]
MPSLSQKFTRFLAGAALIVWAGMCGSSVAQTPEVRAMWVSRFEWPSASQTIAKANIDQIMADIDNNNFNTVLFQVRGQCDVHYPSPDEPWTNTYSWANPGWDPLAYAIASAHSRGLELHAYINTHTLAASVPPGSTTPQHPYNLHGPSAPGEQSWMIRDSGGNAGLVDSYYWISPANTEASAWTRKQIMYIVKNYDVDGVHFDRIRSPGSTYTYDAATQRRFNNGQVGDTNPDGLALGDFMRSQITRDLRNIQGEILYWNAQQPTRPRVKTSAAPFGIVYKDGTTHYQGTGTQSYHSWYQDSWGWLQYHTLDFMVPQIYWNIGSAHPFELLLQDWMEHTGGRFIVAGSTTGSGSETLFNLLDEQQETRLQGAAGHCLFSVSSMGSYWSGFSSTGDPGPPVIPAPYDQPTTVPVMPWKTSPTSGTIVGTIVNQAGQQVVDAKINLTGDIFQSPLGGPYNYLSAHDGFFAILDVTSGSAHLLTASKTGVGRGRAANVSVGAGGVTSVTIVLANREGSLAFGQGSYVVGTTATLSLTDEDLSGNGTTTVTVKSVRETTPETITLTESMTTAGLFTGNVFLSGSTVVNGDGKVQVNNTDTLTASYFDADIGDGSSQTTTATASVALPGPIILESRTSGGGLTAAPTYEELTGSGWTNTTAKSTASGLTGSGGRFIGNGGYGAVAVFRTTIAVGGYYDIAVTEPNQTNGPNVSSPGAGWRITHDGPGGETLGSVDLVCTNTLIANQWLTLATNVPYNAGTQATVTFTNNHLGTAGTLGRFNMDAVRFSINYAPVAVTRWELE